MYSFRVGKHRLPLSLHVNFFMASNEYFFVHVLVVYMLIFKAVFTLRLRES